ncbi:MAG TPA: Ig-like domain-containing protein [Gemmatimonadaceae bacterium]|nr:Ig-like domain-containing protein [Gemmatimonadaceae bacterium]
MRLSRPAVATYVLGLAVACGDSSGPKIGPPATMSVTTLPAPSGPVRTSVGAFAVKVADANGNGVPGVSVGFSANALGIEFSPASDTTDASGIATTVVTLGHRAGSATITALVAGVSAPASATVTATAGAAASLVTTPKAMRFFNIGDSARITYTLRDEFSNLVSGATLAFSVGDPTLVSVDPSGLVKVLRNDGKSTITVSASGRQDTVGVTVLAFGATECTGVVLPRAMSVGAVATVQGGNVCLPGDATSGSEYAVIAYNSSTKGSLFAGATIKALGLAGPPSSLRMPTISGPLLTRSPTGLTVVAPKVLDEDFHLRLLRDARSLRRMFGAARSARDAHRAAPRTSEGGLAPSASASHTVIPSTVQLNEIVNLNVSPSDVIEVRGFRVVAIGATNIMLADTLNPANGFSDADYVRFAARFDTLVYPVDVDNFGAPSDIDGNGKVAVLFTKRVNQLTPANSGSFVGGFFHPRDLFPPSADNPGSNEGEMFYMLVPDPTGTVNGNRHTVGFVDTLTTAVLAHEFQHLINASRRTFVNTAAEGFEEIWLDEGLAHIAEELLYYRESGMQPRQRLTDALIRSTATKYGMWRADVASNFLRLLEYIDAPGSASPIDDIGSGLATRGAAWAFLRYSVDRAFTSDADVWKRFANSTVTGLKTVEAALLTDPQPYLADFALANYISDLGVNNDPRYIHQSWNYRNIFSSTFGSRVDGVFTPLGYYPIKLTGLVDDVSTAVSVKGGSASYYRLAVPAGKEALVTFASSQGEAALNDPFVFTVVRTK